MNHLEILKKGVSHWNQWRIDNPKIVPDLTGANLTAANLTGANLTDANLTDANLTDANLTDANLRYANLTAADLTAADLTDADVRSADLRYADLTDANFTGADLRYANLTGANLTDADVGSAMGNGKEVITIQTPYYTIVWTREKIWVGCKSYTLEEWESMSLDELEKLDSNALKFNEEHRELLLPMLRKLTN